MKRTLATGCILACVVACGTEDVQDDTRDDRTVEDRLSGPITIRYAAEVGNSLKATAYLTTNTRSVALKLTMPFTGDTALPASTLERFRADQAIEVTIVDGLHSWTVRAGANDLKSLNLTEFVDLYETSPSFSTVCGAEIAKAHVVLSDGKDTFEARLSVLDPWRLMGLYETNACEEFDDYGTYGWCSRINGVPCSAVVDCGSALGGTRRCDGDCYLDVGVFNDVCKCSINETACCNAILPPRPVATEETTRFEN